jgi:hypothetical protein
MWAKVKPYLYGLFALYALSSVFSLFCGKSGEEEMVEVPTKGLITTVLEVEKDQFKIEDEQAVENPEQSLIIAKFMDNHTDTFTLEEAKLVEAQEASGSSTGVMGSVVRAAGFGYLGYMLGSRMGGMGGAAPAASAYTNPGVHSRVSSSAGNSVRSSMTRVPRSGSSGFGGGRSTRSFGG